VGSQFTRLVRNWHAPHRFDEAAEAVSSLQGINPLLLPTKTDLSLFITHLMKNKWHQSKEKRKEVTVVTILR